MTVNIIKDPYCDQMKTKRLIEEFCEVNGLYFSDSQTYYFSFSIIKRIPRPNTGFFHTFINGKYSSKYICDGNITEHNIVQLRFQPVDLQPNRTDRIMKSIVNYMDNIDIKVEITYPCDYDN